MTNDAELMSRVVQRDRQAFLRLYDRHSARVHGLSLYMLKDEMTAEENTQDAFLRLWTRADTFQPNRGSLLTWLLTITRRLALDRIRQAGRRPAILEGSPDESWSWIVDPASEGEEFRWQTLRMALQDLPDEQRHVIEFAYYYGLSQSQIAEHLDIPLGTVKTRTRLGMAKLSEAIKDPAGMAGLRSDPAPLDV